MNPTMRRYLICGQLHEIYAVHPNPRKLGRSLGYIVSEGGIIPLAFRPNQKDSKGWEIVACSPSTSLYRELA